MAKKKNVSIDPNLTLEHLAKAYLDFIEKDGKSVGTCFSYLMELKTAMGELGAETLVASLTAEQVDKFNKSKRVTKLKSGKPKSQLSIDKTRRVLRLALAFGEQHGLIERSPIAAKAHGNDEPSSTPPAKQRRGAKTMEREAAPAADADINTNSDAPVEASAA